VFTKEDPKETLPTLPQSNYPSISDIIINIEGIEKLLRNINISKTSGPYNIPNWILKNCAYEIAPFIANIFQLSLDTGTLPSDWRDANISSVFKKGDRHTASNYRPVSLTSVLCKTLEHIICRHILQHLERYNFLTSLQHGFRSGHSCESQLVITMHDIMKTFNLKLQSDLVILGSVVELVIKLII